MRQVAGRMWPLPSSDFAPAHHERGVPHGYVEPDEFFSGGAAVVTNFGAKVLGARASADKSLTIFARRQEDRTLSRRARRPGTCSCSTGASLFPMARGAHDSHYALHVRQKSLYFYHNLLIMT